MRKTRPPEGDRMEKRNFKIKNISTRADGTSRIISGYFAVFNDLYQVWDGAYEAIAPGAFKDALKGDIRALYNHNDDVILGRTSAYTLTLKEDHEGLYGEIIINESDAQAMNVYARVQRRDVTGASIGFVIEEEEQTTRPDGTALWTIIKINPLIEVSICPFPASESTHIEARGKQLEAMKRKVDSKRLMERKRQLREKLGR